MLMSTNCCHFLFPCFINKKMRYITYYEVYHYTNSTASFAHFWFPQKTLPHPFSHLLNYLEILFTLHNMMTSSNGNISRCWACVRGIHRWPANLFPHTHTNASDMELWCFLWICAWINGRVINHEAVDLRRHRAHYDVIVMIWNCSIIFQEGECQQKSNDD